MFEFFADAGANATIDAGLLGAAVLVATTWYSRRRDRGDQAVEAEAEYRYSTLSAIVEENQTLRARLDRQSGELNWLRLYVNRLERQLGRAEGRAQGRRKKEES